MSENNFKNSFKAQEMYPKSSRIIIQRLEDQTKNKLQTLIQIYIQDTYSNGYNHHLAFRVIALYLNTKVQVQFNLQQEIERYLKNLLSQLTLAGVRHAMDITLLQGIQNHFPKYRLKLWRIRILHVLKQCYKLYSKDRRRIGRVLRQQCNKQLTNLNVQTNKQIHAQILRILLEEEKDAMTIQINKANKFKALQYGNNIIRILEKVEQSTYQNELMIAYWDIAQLHYDLHYIVYASQYLNNALNISKRIGNEDMQEKISKFLSQIKL